MVFDDRIDAGRKLSEKLLAYKGSDALVLAIPRGGVVVAAEIARTLSLPLDLLIIQKIGHPVEPEYAVGAVSEDGSTLFNETEKKELDEAWLAEEVQKKMKEAKRRRHEYLGDRQSLSLQNKTVLLVDDGIATGLSMFLAMHEVKQKGASHIVVAVPVVPADIAEKIKHKADLVTLFIPESFEVGVGAYYKDFSQIEDAKIINLLHAFPKN